MPDIHHNLFIAAPAEKVYDAITTQEGLSGWWCPGTTAKPEVDSIARFDFQSREQQEMKITELKPVRLVKWFCLKADEEWIGTTLSFELQPAEKGTRLSFHQDGWKEYTQMFAVCNYTWALFMRSLKLLCETGKGRPSPNQLQ